MVGPLKASRLDFWITALGGTPINQEYQHEFFGKFISALKFALYKAWGGRISPTTKSPNWKIKIKEREKKTSNNSRKKKDTNA